MANATDAILARYQAELEEKKIQMDGIIEAAQADGRDVRPEEMDLYNRAKERMQFLETSMQPLREGARIAAESSRRTSELHQAFAVARDPRSANVEYRSAGAYIADLYHARLGDDDAGHRLDIYHRVAAHQTTADNPGLLPETIVVADRQLHRGGPPARQRASAPPISGRAPGRMPGSPNTPWSPNRPVRRRSSPAGR